MNLLSNKNINWINAAKAICIIAVFFVHCESYYGFVFPIPDALIHPFYVNGFFFVSGYLLFWKQLSSPRIDEKPKQFLNNSGGGKTLTLNILFRIVLPSVLFAMIEFFPKKIIKGEAVGLKPFLLETLGGCTYWFTSALAVAELLFLLLLITRKKSIWFYVVVAIALTSLGDLLVTKKVEIIAGSSSFPWQYKHGLICMIYLAAGGVYWKYESWFKKLMKRWVLVVLLAVFVILSIRFEKYLYQGYMVSMCLTHPLGVGFGIFASVLLVELCKLLPQWKPLTFIGQNSIGFYFMSGALPITFSVIAHKLVAAASPFVMLMVWIACLVTAYVAVWLINKWLPWLFDLRIMKRVRKKETL